MKWRTIPLAFLLTFSLGLMNTKAILAADCESDDECNKPVIVVDNGSEAPMNLGGGGKMACNQGECVPVCTIKDCDDSDPCTTDSCDTTTGECIHDQIPNCTASPAAVTNSENSQINQEMNGGSADPQSNGGCNISPLCSTVSSWPMILPLFAGTGWIGWVRNRRRGKM